MIGGLSGTEPGRSLPGGHVILPVNFDSFTFLVMFPLLNTYYFTNFLGTLDANGSSTAQLNAPALPPGFVGVIMYYAYCLSSPFDFASNPVEIEIVP